MCQNIYNLYICSHDSLGVYVYPDAEALCDGSTLEMKRPYNIKKDDLNIQKFIP